MTRLLSVTVERWPIAGRFAIARGAKTEALTVVAAINDGTIVGRGEAVPYGRYGESVGQVMAALDALADRVTAGLDRRQLAAALPPGAARNALDCALWDFGAKRAGVAAAAQAGLAPLRPLPTAVTISLGDPADMAAAAAAVRDRSLLKIKLDDIGVAARLAAVRRAAPAAQLIVDANEAWSPDSFAAHAEACAAAGVALIEQPLPADADAALAWLPRPVPVCADESIHVATDVAPLVGRYDFINVKLDKAGGLTEALAVIAAARRAGLGVMVGCMVASSLAMAPAFLAAQLADFVDLDGPLLLARDRRPGLRYDQNLIHPPTPALWG